jgi:hypothetical protein
MSRQEQLSRRVNVMELPTPSTAHPKRSKLTDKLVQVTGSNAVAVTLSHKKFATTTTPIEVALIKESQ